MADEDEQPRTPLLRVITPDATDEEIAALVALFAAMATAGGASVRTPAPVWSAPSRMHRRPLSPGPGAWRASGLPG